MGEGGGQGVGKGDGRGLIQIFQYSYRWQATGRERIDK